MGADWWIEKDGCDGLKLLCVSINPCVPLTKFVPPPPIITDEQVAKSSSTLDGFNTSRMHRANISDIQSSVDELTNGLAKLRKDNEKSIWMFF